MEHEERAGLNALGAKALKLPAKSTTAMIATAFLSLVFFCAANARGQHVGICSPASGTTVSSPFQLQVITTGSPTSITVDENNNLLTQAIGTNSLQSWVNLPTGNYTILATAVYSGGNKTATSTITVAQAAGSGSFPLTEPAQIAGDQLGLNEALPQSPAGSSMNFWDWTNGPVYGLGNNPPQPTSGYPWNYATAWGIVYQAAQGNNSPNTRVNICCHQLWVMNLSGLWSQIQSYPTYSGGTTGDGMTVQAYLEDQSDGGWGADVRVESDGTFSVTAGMNTTAGTYNPGVRGNWSAPCLGKAGEDYSQNCMVHFYPTDRAEITNTNPTSIGGVISCFEARLILGNPNLTDDRSTSAYLAGAGADYWSSQNGSLPPPYGGVAPPIANGKMKYVTNNWRSFCTTSLSQSDIWAWNPPQIQGAGTEGLDFTDPAQYQNTNPAALP